MQERDSKAPRGAVLDPGRVPGGMSLTRHAPAPALAASVRHYWFVRWDLDAAHTQGTLTLPAVNAVLERDTDSVSGVWTRRFERTLTGRGAVFGVLFRSAGFGPFSARPLAALTDRSLRFSEVFGGDVDGLRAAAFATPDDAVVVAFLDGFLAGRPPISPAAREVQAWVDAVEADPTIGRAEALAAQVGVSLRTLQRAFRAHVGVGPKQVIRRYRLLEAADRLHRGQPVDQATLARDLGYADQAHFVRDFSAAIGRPPARYAAAQR